MSDKRSLANVIAIIFNMACYNLYFYELLWGSWEKVDAKALYYLTTATASIYFIIDEIIGYKTNCNKQTNLIGKSAIVVNFILFALILYNVLPYPIVYIFILNGSVFAISIMILFSGIRHGYFKD